MENDEIKFPEIKHPEKSKEGRYEEDEFPALGEIKKIHAIEREKRLEGIRESIDKIAVHAIRFFAILAAIMVLFLFIHIALPVKWAFLEDFQLQQIKAIIFSSALGATISRYMNDVFKRR